MRESAADGRESLDFARRVEDSGIGTLLLRDHFSAGASVPRSGAPRLLVGAGGPRMLRLAARHADIVGVLPAPIRDSADGDDPRDRLPAAFDAKVGVLREAAGDRFGYPISEDLLLGLGRGLGFVYFHIKGSDPFYGGRANIARPGEEGLEKTAGRRTGVAVTSHSTSSARTAQAPLRDLLEADEPVLVYLDMGFLPYLKLPRGYHFGGHVVVVAGYDPDTGRVLVADRDGQLHPVGWDALERARGSQDKPFPPRHTWYTFDFAAAR